MGISIYYSARRINPLSESEEKRIAAVVGGYSVADRIEEYHRTGSGWTGEDFSLYDPPFDEPDIVLDGSTKLPNDSEESFGTSIQHWCRALSELRRVIPDADWCVSVEDHLIEWDEQSQSFDPAKE